MGFCLGFTRIVKFMLVFTGLLLLYCMSVLCGFDRDGLELVEFPRLHELGVRCLGEVVSGGFVYRL